MIKYVGRRAKTGRVGGRDVYEHAACAKRCENRVAD
jgi:hypothetical protein